MNYPRRQQYRRLGRAMATGAAGLLTGGGALLTAVHGGVWIALILLAVTIAMGVRACHWMRLATRSRVGARSEEQVQRALAPLVAEGWRLRHSLPWQGRGDIDSVAIAPTEVAFAIETKCAARRPVVSPAQPGGTRREVLGSNGLPGSER